MYEKLLDVLMYMFENYVNRDKQLKINSKKITSEMLKEGFDRNQITKGLFWWSDLFMLLSHFKNPQAINKNMMRVYTPIELEKISTPGRGYLLYLEQTGIVDPLTREIIIDRVMALDSIEIEVTEIKWVTLMVLFNEPELHNQLLAMEELVLNAQAEVAH